MKKIGVIGTSNSVMVGSYIDALKIDFEVVNFSSGRVPVFYHIRTLLNFQSELSNCDYILIDHYINDYNFYDDNLGSDYFNHIKNFYSMLCSFNKPVINMFFPISQINKSRSYYKSVIRLSNECGFHSLNLNEYNFERAHFSDPIHLIKEVSFLVGLELSNYLKNNQLDSASYVKPAREVPYYIVSASDISDQAKEGVQRFENSLMSFNYIEINTNISLRVRDNSFLVSVGYFNPESGKSYAICINGDNYILPDVKYFHESVPPKLSTSNVNLSPVIKESDVECLMGRGDKRSSNSLVYANIVELLMFTGWSEKAKEGAASVLMQREIRLGLDERLEGLFPTNSRLISESDIDTVRDAATEIGERNLVLSLELISIAKRARPRGPYIINKFNELHLLKNNV